MWNFLLDPKREQSEPFTKRMFQIFRDKLPGVTFGTHAGLTILLSYLLDLSQRHASVDRWFRCNEETLETDLGLVPPTQARLIQLLEKVGYLEIKPQTDFQSARYLRANLDEIEHDLTSPEEK